MVDWVCGSLIPRLHLTTLLHRLWLQITSFTHNGSGHTQMLWLHFNILEGSGDASSIFFFLQSMVQNYAILTGISEHPDLKKRILK